MNLPVPPLPEREDKKLLRLIEEDKNAISILESLPHTDRGNKVELIRFYNSRIDQHLSKLRNFLQC